MISFVEINGEIIPKTKMGFENDQTIEVEKIYKNNKSIKEFVDWCLDNDIVSMWEFVSFKNRIVLNYDKPNLILLRLRDNKTGDYLDIEKYRGKGFDVVEEEDYTVDEFIELSKTLTDKEGCVFTLKNGNGDEMMVKQKTQDYFEKHNLLTNDINREDYVIESILNNSIDDIVAQLDKKLDSDKIDFIHNIEGIVSEFLRDRISDINVLVSKYNGSKKDFALRYNKDINFSLSMAVINNKTDVHTATKNWLKKQTNHLKQAQSFVERKGFKRK